MSRRGQRNIEPRSVQSVHQKADGCSADAELTFFWAEEQAIETIHWYLQRKRSRSRWSKVCRGTGIVLGLLGGLTPLIHAAGPDLMPEPDWGFVLLGAAAGTVVSDRVFGFSSSWTRFMLAQAELQERLSEAQQLFLTWHATGGTADPKDLAALNKIAADLSGAVASIVRNETSTWNDDLVSQITAENGPWPKQDLGNPGLPVPRDTE